MVTDKEFAELKAFTRALGIFMILSWFVFLFVLGYVLFQIHDLPAQVVSQLNEQLNFTPIK